MNMFKAYLEEREGVEVVEFAFGFCVLKSISPEVLYLQDLYVEPSQRHNGKAQEIQEKCEKLARSRGASKIVTSVAPLANNSTYSVRIILEAGYELHSAEKDLIWFSKQL